MKQTNWWLVAALLLLAGWALPGNLLAGNGQGIKGSKHDFSGEDWNNGGLEYGGEVCRVCHAPHDRGLELWQGSDSGLLWNHSVSTAEYSMYSSASLAGTIEDQPIGRSKLCLSCHDGTVALDAFDGRQGDIDTVLTGRFVIGALKDGAKLDLRGHHPVSVQYVDNTKIGMAGGLHDPADKTWYDHSPVSQYLEFGRVECHSCHDVHNRVSVPNTVVLRAGIRTGQGGAQHASLLCLTCHNK
ncbi:cytochrome C [Desulfurivibrio sp. C05AmB]|uniref:cytochrome C n=1 Tax=Desulfurivibrio sp. C05AmB TaxID=3374371 RepID=UPI00376F3DD8